MVEDRGAHEFGEEASASREARRGLGLRVVVWCGKMVGESEGQSE